MAPLKTWLGNEIRISQLGRLSLNGGKASSSRWIDIQSGGRLEGYGKISGTLINGGHFKVAGNEKPEVRIDGDYQQFASGQLELNLDESDAVPLTVSGTARLGGKLTIVVAGDDSSKAQSGHAYPLLSAKQIVGHFDHADNEIRSTDGTRFTIASYSAESVTLMTK